MRALGLMPGERVVVQLGNRAEAAAILTACLAAGANFVPLNPAYTAAEMDVYLRKLRPAFYFCEAKYYPSVAEIPTCVLRNARRFVVGDDSTRIDLPSWRTLLRDADGPLPPIDPQAPAVLMHTSGTTGTPKFVALTQASLAQYVVRIVGYGFGDSSRMIITLSCFYISGLTALVNSMANGMSAVLLDGCDPEAVLDVIEQYRCTTMFLTPYMASSLNKAQRLHPRRVDSLRLCVVSGDVCHPSILQEFAELFGQPLQPVRGMTESIGKLSIGRTPGAYVAAAASARLVDEGELVIRGDNLFRGDWLGPGQWKSNRRCCRTPRSSRQP
jgi:acyl-CoA synthetase (AMP-forming)/AMP-acid ligase II